GAFSWTPTEAQGPASTPITVRVTDNGSPALSAAETITVTVNEVNSAPVVTNPGNKTTNELANLAFTVTATDSDIPANTLTFSLDAGAPAGATIGASSGAFSWTPSSSGTFPVTVRVTDNGSPAMSSFEVVSISVSSAANRAPTLNPIGNKTVNELSALTFTATASDPDAGQTLTFSLDAGAPAGATIGASSGAFSWTPTEAQGPASTPITVRVTDNGSPALSDFETITVTVNEVNSAPVLAAIGNKTTNEQALLAFTATASDADVPAHTLTFSLDPGAATSAATNGAISWTPSAAQGPARLPMTVRVTDNGSPAMSDFEVISITVQGVNHAPVLSQPSDMTVAENATADQPLSATDPDGDTVTFSKVSGPAFMTVDGSIHLAPGGTDAGSYTGTVKATDPGGLSDQKSFQITVTPSNSAPTAKAGGPYNGSVGANINFDGTGSTDPDGDVLT